MIRPEIDAGELSIPKNLPIIIYKITEIMGAKLWCDALNARQSTIPKSI